MKGRRRKGGGVSFGFNEVAGNIATIAREKQCERPPLPSPCPITKEERNALEEMRKLDVRDMEEFGRLESSEKTIAILGDRWWPQTAKQDGERISKQFLCNI